MNSSEVFLQKIAGSDATARAGDIDRLHELCICNSCLTYNECMREKGELLFCIRGRSPSCTFEKKGCTCPTCPVTKLAGLSRTYFCIRGSKQEQRSTAQGL
ncbi:MAG: hypothetical protein A4E35_01779 [Methanoregula sp. PtaU1.Bin051]|nr:MAG: hypothetical protein A4E35_01779 [Methanoregula sp. PtaU1.Bin051]